MRIVIDMQGVQSGSRYRGIGRYTLSFTQGIIKANTNHEIILVLSSLFPDSIDWIRSIFHDTLPQQNIRVWTSPSPVGFLDENNFWRRQSAELLREAYLLSLYPDVVLISTLFEGTDENIVTSVAKFTNKLKIAVIVYDLIPFLNRESYLGNPQVERWYMEKLAYLKKADAWLAISESSKQEAIEHAQIPADRICNISTASDEKLLLLNFTPSEIIETQNKIGVTRPFVMYCSASDPRKNHLRLIAAYSALPKHIRDTHQLVFVGGMPHDDIEAFKKYATKVGLSENELVISGYLDDKSIYALYHSCKCFVFPSWHEGFGLPVLEAMSCGAPVIGSNCSSIPEVIENPEALFDPFSESAISEKICQVLIDDDFRQRLICHGLRQSKKFSWEIISKRALSTLERLFVVPQNNVGSPPRNKYSGNKIVDELIDAISNLLIAPSAHSDLTEVAKAIDASIWDDSRPMKLFVDISKLVQRDSKTGIQRVVRSIVNALLVLELKDYTVEFVYATTVSSYRKAGNYISNLKGEMIAAEDDQIIVPRAGDIFLGLDLQIAIMPAQALFFEKIKRLGVSVYFIVYDLLPISFNKYFSSNLIEDYRRWLDVVANSHGAICISKSVADELSEWIYRNKQINYNAFSIRWFHLGADIESSAPSLGLPVGAKELLDALLKRKSFLSVGTLEPRKCHAQILAAFELTWEQGIDANLVLVGKQGWLVDELVNKLRLHPEINKRLFWLEDISDEFLEQVYYACTCLIAASEGEGFGLPLIEAAQHKLSIIARNIPVFREVAGDHAYYFNGFDPQALADAISTWLDLNAEGHAPQSTGMSWLTWQQSTEQLIDRILLLK